MVNILMLEAGASNFKRQIPQSMLSEFSFDFMCPVKNKKYDYVFWQGELKKNYILNVGKIIYVCGEPEDIENFGNKFYDQFDEIISTNRKINHKNIVYKQFLPWHIGKFKNLEKYDLNFFLQTDFSKNKKKNLCGITSDKAMTKGHVLRKDFLKNAVYFFRGGLDLYGRGINDFADKIDFLPEYKYQIVIENSSVPDYWTEKLADSFLAECFTFYYGAQNIKDYFPEESLVVVDIEKPLEAMELIEKKINENAYEKHIADIKKSKERILGEYNFSNFIKNNFNETQNYSRREIHSADSVSFFQRIKNVVKKIVLNVMPYYFAKKIKRGQQCFQS